MSLKKTILLIALGISFQGTIMSMEKEIHEQITLINRFTYQVLYHEAKQIKPLGDWLMRKRNDIRDDASWNTLINDFLGKITLSEDNDWQDESKRAISIVIEEIARDLQPGQDYSQMLAEHAVKAVDKAINKWTKAHDFEAELIV